MKIPFGKPLIDKSEIDLVVKTLNQPVLVHGKITEKFEKKFGEFVGCKYSVAVSSCTAGMHLGYIALGIGEGDEVLVTSQTHVATAHTIEYVGAKPVFVDCEANFGNIDINKLEKKITKKTKAISVVHFIGMPVDMVEIMKIAKKYNLFVIEDCALAVGSKIKNKHVGLFGAFDSCYFYPIKHMTTTERGMIVTKKKKIFQTIKKIRAFGYKKNSNFKLNYDVDMLGYNYRMNEIEAAIGLKQLDKIKNFLISRKNNFEYLYENISKINGLELLKKERKEFTHSHYCITFILKDKKKDLRNLIIQDLQRRGIGTSIYYPGPVPMFSYYKKKYKLKKSEFKNAHAISNNSISLPVGPHLSKKQLDSIVKNLKDLF